MGAGRFLLRVSGIEATWPEMVRGHTEMTSFLGGGDD